MIVNLLAECDPHEKQREALASHARFTCIAKGIGAGGTYTTTYLALRRIVEDLAKYQARGERWRVTPGVPLPKQDPFLLYWFIGPTYRLSLRLEREVIRILRPLWKRIVIGRTSREIWLRGGVLLEFKSAVDPDNLVADTVDGIAVTETARLKPGAWKGSLRSRLRGRVGRDAGWAVFDTSPKGRNWFWSELWRFGDPTDPLYDGRHVDPQSARYGAEPVFANYRWKTTDNTKSPGTVADALEAKRHMPLRYWERDYGASFEAFEGNVYPEFDRAVHVVPVNDCPTTFHTIVAGVDWGWRHPGAIVVVGEDRHGVMWIVAEEFERELVVAPPVGGGDSWVARAQALRNRFGIRVFTCGADEPASIQAFTDGGLPAEAAKGGVLDGIRHVAMRLHTAPATLDGPAATPHLRVSELCANVVSGFGRYKWRQTREGQAESEEPDKVDDDAMDALRYAVGGLVALPSYVGGRPGDPVEAERARRARAYGRRAGVRGLLGGTGR